VCCVTQLLITYILTECHQYEVKHKSKENILYSNEYKRSGVVRPQATFKIGNSLFKITKILRTNIVRKHYEKYPLLKFKKK